MGISKSEAAYRQASHHLQHSRPDPSVTYFCRFGRPIILKAVFRPIYRLSFLEKGHFRGIIKKGGVFEKTSCLIGAC
jgi:hypothetical protein